MTGKKVFENTEKPNLKFAEHATVTKWSDLMNTVPRLIPGETHHWTIPKCIKL